MKKFIIDRNKQVFVPLQIHVPAGEDKDFLERTCKAYQDACGKGAENKLVVNPLYLTLDSMKDLTDVEKDTFAKVLAKTTGFDMYKLKQQAEARDSNNNNNNNNNNQARSFYVPLCLHVDLREPGELRQFVTKQYQEMFGDEWQKRLSFGQQETSDYYFTQLDPDTLEDTGQVYGCIIERASAGDCAEKIINKRFYQQKEKMVSTGMPRENIFYLFEGDPTSLLGAQKQTRVAAAQLSTNLRDGFSCVQTSCYQSTILWILDKHLRLERTEPDKLEPNTADTGRYVDMHQHKKLYSGENKIYSTLTGVLGISTGKAAQIAAKYPKFSDLVNAAFKMAKKGRDPHLLIYDLEIEGIGKKLSARIIDEYNICDFHGMPKEYSCGRKKPETDEPKKELPPLESKPPIIKDDEDEDVVDEDAIGKPRPRKKRAKISRDDCDNDDYDGD
jgi:ERCC4-type nuclease